MTDKIVNSIEESFRKALGSENFEYKRPYSTTIEVLGIGHESRIWVRILQDLKGVVCDISTIYFCEELQKNGLFTLIMNELMKNEFISEVRVTSVCTEEMHKACRKFGMEYTEYNMAYSLKVHS